MILRNLFLNQKELGQSDKPSLPLSPAFAVRNVSFLLTKATLASNLTLAPPAMASALARCTAPTRLSTASEGATSSHRRPIGTFTTDLRRACASRHSRQSSNSPLIVHTLEPSFSLFPFKPWASKLCRASQLTGIELRHSVRTFLVAPFLGRDHPR